MTRDHTPAGREKRAQEYDTAQHERAILSGLIGEQVMHTLGQPGSLLQVQGRRLWEDRYRLNIPFGADAPT